VAILAVILISSFGIVGQAQAGFWDGNKLMEFYREVEKADANASGSISWLKVGQFTGYVVGVSDALETLICYPSENVKIRAANAIVGNYLKAHPESLGKSGDAIILKALKEAYPCPKK
jgi:hypothetical protein